MGEWRYIRLNVGVRQDEGFGLRLREKSPKLWRAKTHPPHSLGILMLTIARNFFVPYSIIGPSVPH